jgi:hypothetical protein
MPDKIGRSGRATVLAEEPGNAARIGPKSRFRAQPFHGLLHLAAATTGIEDQTGAAMGNSPRGVKLIGFRRNHY